MTVVQLERRRLSDAAVSQLLDLIRSGALPIGTKLPSERQLAAQFGVSRVLVRETLRALEALGVVEVQAGIGAFVSQQSPMIVQIASYLRAHPTEVQEVVEVRTALAQLVGELAARRASEEELTELERLFSAQRDALAAGKIDDLPALDERFHDLIYGGTRNHLLIAMHQHTITILNDVNWNHITLRTRPKLSLDEHGRIVAALQSRDANAAGKALRLHAERSDADIRAFVEQMSAEARRVRRDDRKKGAE